jgi:hypothetical protein
MKYLSRISFLAVLALLRATAFAQQAEKPVSFVTADHKYIMTGAKSTLELKELKAGSKHVFTLIDMNGGTLDDGDEVQIRYNPNVTGDPKPNYWGEKAGALSRRSVTTIFKMKKIESAYAFQAPSGKFVAAPTSDTESLSLADSVEGALKLEVVDPPAVKSGSSKDGASAADKAADKQAGD